MEKIYAALISAPIAFLGIVFTYLYNKRQSERLQMETFLKAIDLITSNELDDESLAHRRETIIGSYLAQSGNIPTAFSLVETFYPEGKISLRLLMEVVNRCIVDGEKSTKNAAIWFLEKQKQRIIEDTDDRISFPSVVFPKWFKDRATIKRKFREILKPDINFRKLGSTEKNTLREILIQILISKPKSHWQPNVPNQVINLLWESLISEKKEEQRICSALYLAPLLREKLSIDITSGYINPQNESVDFKDYQSYLDSNYTEVENINWLVSKRLPITQDTWDIYRELVDWCESSYTSS